MKSTETVHPTNETELGKTAPPPGSAGSEGKLVTIFSNWTKRLMTKQAEIVNGEQGLLDRYEVWIPDARTVAEALEAAWELTNDANKRPYAQQVCSTTVGDLLLVEGQHYLVTHFYFEPLTEAEAQAIRGLGLADPVVFDQWVAKNGVHRPEATPMVLHPDYWDCECERDYIHRKRQGNYCPWCQSHLEDMPDARLHELLDHYVAARDGAVFRESARPVPSGWGNARADNSGTGGGTGRSRRLPPNTK